jgi:hypothetical protein
MPHVLQLLSAFVPSLQSLAAEPADMEKASKVPTVSVAKALSTAIRLRAARLSSQGDWWAQKPKSSWSWWGEHPYEPNEPSPVISSMINYPFWT